MNSTEYRCNPDTLAELIAQTGACAHGVATAAPVEPVASQRYRQWLAEGKHAQMLYLERHAPLRDNPDTLLPGVRSIIVAAFAYGPCAEQSPNLNIARYALGSDYHKVVKRRLKSVARYIEQTLGEATRICVDSAPLSERYWAAACGVGFIGRNNQLIVPSVGSMVVLGEILTTASLPPTPPLNISCGTCRACVEACPVKAIAGDYSAVDARRCLSYLTIEHRDELPPGTSLHGHLFGCDDCQLACPHNSHSNPNVIAELRPRPEILELTPETILALTPETHSRLTQSSPLRRAPLASLLRNLNHLGE